MRIKYWIVDPAQKTLEQYQLSNTNEYELKVKSNNGLIHSATIDNFSFSIEAIFDESKNSEAIKRIYSTF